MTSVNSVYYNLFCFYNNFVCSFFVEFLFNKLFLVKKKKKNVLYAELYVCVCCFVVCGCAVSRRYIDVCYCDMFSVVNVYLDHLKFCVVCINGRRYVCCSECNVVSNECNESTSCLVQAVGAHDGKATDFWSFCFGINLVF